MTEGQIPQHIKDGIHHHIQQLETKTNRKFGGDKSHDHKMPLLLSVRAGAFERIEGYVHV
jgi:hypothetical protein